MDGMAKLMSEDGKLVTDGIPSEKIPIDMNLTTVNRSYFSRRFRRKIKRINLRRETGPRRSRPARTIGVTRVGLTEHYSAGRPSANFPDKVDR